MIHAGGGMCLQQDAKQQANIRQEEHWKQIHFLLHGDKWNNCNGNIADQTQEFIIPNFRGTQKFKHRHKANNGNCKIEYKRIKQGQHCRKESQAKYGRNDPLLHKYLSNLSAPGG